MRREYVVCPSYSETVNLTLLQTQVSYDSLHPLFDQRLLSLMHANQQSQLISNPPF